MSRLTGLTLVLLLIALDQLSKFWVESYLPLQQPLDLLPVLALFRTYNTGIAFSLLAGTGDLFLIAISLAICGFIAWLWARSETDRNWARLGYAFVIGGALGNLIDRLRFGHVIDFILFHAGDWSFAVFNLADSFITIGAALILFEEVLNARNGGPSRQGD